MFARLLAAAFLVAALSVCYGQGETPSPGDGSSYPPGVRRVKERGKLIVAQYSGERALFFMRVAKADDLRELDSVTLPDGSLIAGIDITLAKFVAQRLGVPLELKRDYPSFNAVIQAVAKGEADLGVSKLDMTFSRAEIVAFSEPYAIFNMGLATNRSFLTSKEIYGKSALSGAAISTLFDQPDVRIGVQANTSGQELKRVLFPQAKEVVFTRHSLALAEVRDGKIDAAVIDDFEFMFFKMFDPELNVYCDLIKVPDLRAKVAVAAAPDARNLLGVVNQVVDYVKFDDASSLMRKYGKALKNAELSLAETHRAKAGDYSFILAAKKRHSGFDAGDALCVLAVGAPFLLFACLWLRLSKRRS